MDKIKPLAKFPVTAKSRVEEAEFYLSRSLTDVQINRVDLSVPAGFLRFIRNDLASFLQIRCVKGSEKIRFPLNILNLVSDGDFHFLNSAALSFRKH
jgi:hypothetical protein